MPRPPPSAAASDAARAARAAHADAAARAGGADASSRARGRSTRRETAVARRERGRRRARTASPRSASSSCETDAAAAAERDGARRRAGGRAARRSPASSEQSTSARRGGRRRARRLRHRSPPASPTRPGVVALAQALADAHADAVDARRGGCDDAAADLDARVAASAFADVADATAALRDAAVRATRSTQRIREHDAALRAERDRLRDLELELAGAPEEPVDVAATADGARRRARAVEQRRWMPPPTPRRRSARLRDLLAARRGSAHAAIAELADEHDVIARLANTVAGRAPNTHRMTLESFVLAAELEEIVEAANLRLDDMSSGPLPAAAHRRPRGARRGIRARPARSWTRTPARRGPRSRCRAVRPSSPRSRSRSVSPRSSPPAPAACGSTRSSSTRASARSTTTPSTSRCARSTSCARAVARSGVISHVEAMKEQLPAQLLVEATAQGPSVIRQEVAATV